MISKTKQKDISLTVLESYLNIFQRIWTENKNKHHGNI